MLSDYLYDNVSFLCLFNISKAKYEDDADIDAIYNESSFLGEYDCNTKTLMVGFTGHFDANAFTANPAEKMPSELADLLNDDGCLLIFF